ncbi:MAG: ATP-grasp domain-containing protein [Thermodesulfobacteriota bacterium]
MPADTRVLVVGTTPDYVDWICRADPGRALFITEPALRRDAREPAPGPRDEILCDLARPDHLFAALLAHLRKWNIEIDGVACFDCESLPPAAFLAQKLGLNFVSPQAVAACRDKQTSKTLWKKNGIFCPIVAPIFKEAEAVEFFTKNGVCVLKPAFGAGSELVFRCDTRESCRRAFDLISKGLLRRSGHRLYRNTGDAAPIIAETCVNGPEFSCDFFVESGRATLIRLAKKIPAPPGSPFGTTLAYVLVEALPGIDNAALARNMADGASALGISRSLCMADFIVHEGRPALLEMTPRPGGDCLPPLIRHALDIDTLLLALDVAQHRPLSLADCPPPRLMAGLRFHARQEGVLTRADWSAIAGDPRVREVLPVRHPGDKIFLPPRDYDSFLLGSAVFAPAGPDTLAEECAGLLNRLIVEISPHDDTA